MSTTKKFPGYQGRELLARIWKNKTKHNGKVIVLLHRGHEHSERLDEVANYASFDAYKKYAYDYRGHGYEKGEPSYDFMDLVRDLDCFIQFVQEDAKVAIEDIFIVANSVAGVVAATWLHDYAPQIAGAALVAPAFKIKLYVPLAKEALDVAVKFKPKLHIKSYVKSKFLTHDTREQKRYNTDPLITPDIPAKQLTTLLDTAQRIVKDAAAITTPLLVLSATKDYVVESKVQGDFFANLSSANKKFIQLEGYFHGVLYENKKDIALQGIDDFMKRCFRSNPKTQIDALITYTQNEKHKIAYGTLPLCQEFSFCIQRAYIKYLGSLSNGIKIGKRYGFDSGVTLDYVYKNRAQGKFAIGKFADMIYLNSVGWKGIRQRKVNLETLMINSIDAMHAQKRDVKIMDIAGGPAKYLIEMARKYENIEILVRDYQEQNIELGKKHAKRYSLENIKYEQCDSFDSKNYLEQDFAPNIIIISGVFELFDDNKMIQKAIDGVSNMLKSGDILLYTNQPWHPQLAQIANVLGNHQGKKWIMRRRTQYEIDALFEKSGFKKETMLIDNYG
ncbi:MAG: bifunctional alpha/beta hydrolase/class I SAM-dependent methyltransferase, partial [Campylobacterales bacterium]|nr:bifunctional alpha/beta hydrolase/class I SAM-dependent methyltransferase [Campylobacterales bacterium]